MSNEKTTILLVDDEQQMLLAMETALARAGFAVLKATNGQEALELLEKAKVDLAISDMRMPVMTGDEFLRRAHERQPELPVIMITAYGTIHQAVDAMRHGAFDFITKPFSAEDLENVVRRAVDPMNRVTATKPKVKDTKDAVSIVTNDPGLIRVLEIATTVAQSSASVLIQGESGTGKELIARLVHLSSPRKLKPFVAVNCAALPGNLLESELFGHEKGSFTGAVGLKIGKFEQADAGTILLDEISEMEQILQAKLLRVLQEREVDRVGGMKPIPIDVRVVATTNRQIAEEVRKGTFREDLYYRLNVIPLVVPPLRERRTDIKLLVEHFVRRSSGGKSLTIPESVIKRLEAYDWPGNVRELQNACERAVLLAGNRPLSADHFLLGSMANVEKVQDDKLQIYSGLSVADAERTLIFETLRATNNNKTRAAELLGISIRTLRNKLHEYGVVEADR